MGFTLVSSTRSVLLDVGRVSQYSGNYTAIFPGKYYLRFDNSYSIFTTKTVSLSYSLIPPIVNIEEYQWSGNMITGYLRNYGQSYVNTNNAQVSLNGISVGSLGGTCAQAPLNPNRGCTFSISVPNSTWVSGSPYVLKIATPTGTFSFPLVAGGNSESVIETQTNLITFQTVNTEVPNQIQNSTNGPPQNQLPFGGNYTNNAFAMIGAVAGGILLLGALLGLFAISIAHRNTGRASMGKMREDLATAEETLRSW